MSKRFSVFYRVVKRCFDIVFSLVVLVLFFIPGLLLSILIAIQTKGSPIYTQERIGRGGKAFKLFKFRSMYADADNLSKYLSPEQIVRWEVDRKVDDDPRITPIGKFIRTTSLDEIPQVLNVLLGQMSVVGVRPIVDEELHWYGDEVDEFLSRIPGITGWWQAGARNEAIYETGERQELELYYVRNASFSFDLKIILMTFGAIFKRTGR